MEDREGPSEPGERDRGFDFGRAPAVGAALGAVLGLIAAAFEGDPDGPLTVLARGPLPGSLEIVLSGAAAGFLAGLIAALGWIGE